MFLSMFYSSRWLQFLHLNYNIHPFSYGLEGLFKWLEIFSDKPLVDFHERIKLDRRGAIEAVVVA
jgi:hypothetical protein